MNVHTHTSIWQLILFFQLLTFPNGEFYWHSWGEIGSFDMPAMIDFILDKTQHKQLTCVGHSQGGSVIAVLLSERPEYNEKLSSVHLIAGAIFLKYYNQALEPFLKNLNEIKVRSYFILTRWTDSQFQMLENGFFGSIEEQHWQRRWQWQGWHGMICVRLVASSSAATVFAVQIDKFCGGKSFDAVANVDVDATARIFDR